MLEQNYRSTQNILAAANAVVSRNAGRMPKNLWSDPGDGPPIVGYVADSEHDEAAFVAEEVDRLADEGEATPGDVAVFYRTNAQSRVFEEVFIRAGLPYKVVGGVRFYERREVRDLLAYLRLTANPEDEVSLRRILNVPRRGIGERAEACVAALAQRDRITFAQALARPGDVPGLAGRSAQAIDGVQRADRRAAGRGAAGPARGRPGRDDPGPVRLPGRAAELHRPAGREPDREPERARLGGPRVRRPAPGRDAHRLPRAGVPGGRRRPDPRRGTARRRGHADDPAHRQGPGVSRWCSSPGWRSTSSRTSAR